jgi:hypothetical protein
MDRVHGSAVYRLTDHIKPGPSNLRWRAQIRSHEGVLSFLISATNFTMDSHQRSPAVMVAWTEVHGGAIVRATELGLHSARCDDERWKTLWLGQLSLPRVLQSWGSGGSVSRWGAPRLHAWHWRWLAPVGFRPRQRVGQHQEASAVLPIRSAMLERL